MTKEEIFYLDDENKNEFYKQLYIRLIIMPQKINVKNEMTRLFRLEENFI